MTQPDETTHCHRLASRGAVAFVLWVAMALAFAQMGVAQTTLPGLKPQPNLLDRGSSDNLFKPGGVRDILRKPPEPRVIAPTPPVTLPQVEVPEIKFPSVERTRPTLRAQDREGRALPAGVPLLRGRRLHSPRGGGLRQGPILCARQHVQRGCGVRARSAPEGADG